MGDQVRHDHTLIRERIIRLGGARGGARLEAALQSARAAAAANLANLPSDDEGSQSPRTPTPRSPPRSPSRSPPRNASPGAGQGEGALDNERMVWELLYDLRWQLSTEEVELAWKDATGETNVMKVCYC